jgi:hypothetical protein
MQLWGTREQQLIFLNSLGGARPAHAGLLPAGHTDHDGLILAAPSGTRSVSWQGRGRGPSAHPTTLTPVHPGCGDG